MHPSFPTPNPPPLYRDNQSRLSENKIRLPWNKIRAPPLNSPFHLPPPSSGVTATAACSIPPHPIPSHPIPSPSSCYRGFRAYPASRPLSSAHSLTQRPSSPVTMLGVPAGGSNRRKKGVMYSMGNVCPLSSLLAAHSSLLTPHLPALPIRSVMFCACKYRVFFSGWCRRSDSARAACSVVFGCSQTSVWRAAVKAPDPVSPDMHATCHRPDR
jgi:hypothetical protein